MPDLDQARETILGEVKPLQAEVVPLAEAVGRALVADVIAPCELPAWDNSAMDGYAVRSADCTGPAELEVKGFIPAGTGSPPPVAPGTAARILTGAPLPPGADAVVPFEAVEERTGSIRLRAPVPPGFHVRHRGEDVRAGEPILAAGTAIGPAEVSALATLSVGVVPVVRRARVAVLSTGDELVPLGAPRGPGQIHDSNSLAVAAAVRLAGAEPVVLGIAADRADALRPLLARGLEADALVTTAGVSTGDRDLVREVLTGLGVRPVFWKVDVKPGRPTAFAMAGATPVFSLPGNPVATLLMFELLVRPALLRMMGHRRVVRPALRATLAEALPGGGGGRASLVRVALERRGGGLTARAAGRQDTGMLRTSLRADGVVVVPPGRGPLPAGAPVDVLPLRDLAEVPGEGR